MRRYYNTETGEIIEAQSLKEAKAYFKADGKVNNYQGKTKPYKKYDLNTLGVALGGLSIVSAIIITAVCLVL